MCWLNRSALSYTPYGLYVPTTIDVKSMGLQYSSTLDEWETTAIRLAQNNTGGYVKIVDWGIEPESLENISSNPYSYEDATKSYSNFNKSSRNISSGSYGGCGNVSQLGSYTKTTGTNSNKNKDVSAKTKNRENILNTLVNGSYTPNNIKKCNELTSSDKKKNVKV
jgi:hypothetical protein